jgi:hypothetical protein
MSKSQSSQPAGSTNFLTYLVVGVTGLGILGFAYLLFGQQLIVAVVVCGLVGGVGCLHYLLWGRALMSDGEREKSSRPAESAPME